MKKLLAIILAGLLLTLAGCGESAANKGKVIEIKEKMFLTQTNDIWANVPDYLGATIRYEGIFKEEHWEGNTYRSVIRYGPGCCGSDANCGFEVLWDDANAAYPKPDDWVAAEGVLEQYEENGMTYLRLRLSKLNVLPTRGLETVSQ